MARKRRFGRRWNVDLTAGKLNLICLKRWNVLNGIGQAISGNYQAGLNAMGDGSITGVLTDAISAAAGYKVKKVLAPGGVPMIRTRNGKIGL